MSRLKYEPVLVSSAVRATLLALVGTGLLAADAINVNEVVALFSVGGIVETVISILTRRKTRSKASLPRRLDWHPPSE